MASLRKDVLVKLGLIQFPVNVKTAVQDDKAASFNTLCRNGHDPVKIKMPMTCPTCDATDGFVKGKATANGWAIVTDEALEDAAVDEETKTTLALTAHPAEDLVRALPGGKVYYLAPSMTTGEGYTLLVALIKARPDIAFCSIWAARTSPAMYRLVAFGDTLAITELAWPALIKPAPTSDVPLNEAMLPLAAQFVDQLLTPFDPNSYRDTRAETLAAFVAAAEAVAGGEAPPEAATPAPVSNSLMDALAAAVEATQPKAKKKAKAKSA